MDAEAEAVAARYERFAREEAPGRSNLYAAWAAQVAADPQLQRVLARIPARHRQPPLVFAVTRLLGAGEPDAATWRDWVLVHADAVVRECEQRSLQTNEPLRCAALLPALSRIPGPIALLEIGASAGLCLFPDRYSYRYRGAAGEIALDPAGGPSPVVLECEVRGERMPEVSLPDIVWRAGIDLAPLNPAAPDTHAWLTGLVWPGEAGRADRVDAALRIAASDPPLLVAGDGADLLAEVAAAAPAEATLVVQTPGVLAHIPWVARHELIAAARGTGRWITLDAPGLHEGWATPVDTAAWPGGFALALDGDVLAATDPLGGWLAMSR
ncbi:MAG: hypothetical protein ABS62_04305 [Microbacterium sp. SCN 70-200]|uniref:DUF2332 domain-containing protein n=1 Tax=unclassified Microbacterium TaxID=2609290 RepID=UPI00086AE4D9|nr:MULTISPECIES: DUF2332 domain-containing protein [unclassified Microbacterium]MBN9213554.1 DUF2332 domain-containing protein [Microbacterium sp.]ODT42290.1 MAG: hypothetical protein ABS62_04305 [Microbacterium sp. SCN 70-200]OJV79080.1 MAG: hypothetical protein BGO46_02035 [Microbacterium sp. 70-16]